MKIRLKLTVDSFKKTSVFLVLCSFFTSSLYAEAATKLYPHSKYLSGNWNGYRTQLYKNGYDFELSYTTEPASLLTGGYDKGNATYLHNINFQFKADLEKLFDLKNTYFLAKVSSRNGNNLSEMYVVPNKTADGRYIYGEYFNKSQEIYGGQKTKLVNFQISSKLNEKVSVDVGRLVMNDYFLRSDIYCNFMNNSTCGAPKGVFTPYVLDAYPDATMGVHTEVKLNDELYLQLGLFDGGWAQQQPYGFDWGLGKNGTVLAAEAQYFLAHGATYGKKRVIKVGMNHNSGRFDNFKTGKSTNANDTYYILADIGVYSEGESSDQGLSFFGSFVYNRDDEVSALPYFYNLGLVYKGVFNGRDEDNLGVNYVHAKHSKYNTYTHDFITSLRRADEQILEINYNYILPYGIELMPDFQYIIHPNGSEYFDNALVAGVKVNVNF